MELRHLQYFLMVAREGTISGAAHALHLSHPSLSRQMQDLEQELGLKLFDRGSRRIELTAAGMRLRRRAEEIVDLVGRTEAELRVSAETLTGEVRSVSFAEKRVNECVKMGFKKVVFPAKNFKSVKKFEDKIELVPVRTVGEMIRKLFPEQKKEQAEE